MIEITEEDFKYECAVATDKTATHIYNLKVDEKHKDKILKALRLLDLVEKRWEKYIWLSDKSDTEEKILQELQNLLEQSEVILPA